MTRTLTYVDTLTRTGYTTIDGIKVVQYSCTIPSDNPQNMRISITKLDPDMYKTHRAVCREDFAAFEDAAYVLQDEYIAKMSS
jgi:hypothetical protein